MFKSISSTNLNAYDDGGDITGSLQKSNTIANCTIEKKRGFKPSDRKDPNKRQFLTHLSQQIWQKKNESTNVSKKIDLHKIFTPATDAEEILPKNRKLYASSAFYSSSLHPTVEDQVELARRISHSLSDINNQQSKGQSMYVNRKKRSVKWVHEGCGQGETTKSSAENINITNQEEYFNEEEKENNESHHHHEKVPLKYLMNPCGKMRDINSIRESINTETGLLSPDVSAEVMTALQTQKGKGAELFAKRRKVSENWVVGESNTDAQSPSDLTDYQQSQQQPKQSTSPSILPAYTDAAKHRVQLNLHQEQLLEKYAKPVLKVVQTPWEAALNSGSASAAFVEEQKLSPYPSLTPTCSPTPQLFGTVQGELPLHGPTMPDSYNKPCSTDNYQKYINPPQLQHKLPQDQAERQQYTGINSQRELAYKPSIPQGWKAPSMFLPKDLYMPKEIPLQSYAPPPIATIPPLFSSFSNAVYDQHHISKHPSALQFSSSASTPATTMPLSGCTFPIKKPVEPGFSTVYNNNQPPKQQYLAPQSYQTIPQNISQNVPQVNFNPSPLPYDKLAKFENQPTDDYFPTGSPSSSVHLNIRRSKVRNISPTPFAGSNQKAYTPSTESNNNFGTPSISPRPLSSLQQHSGNTTPNPQSIATTNQIWNAPSYNSSARGWGRSAVSSFTSYTAPQQQCLIVPSKHEVNSSSIPYTDF